MHTTPLHIARARQLGFPALLVLAFIAAIALYGCGSDTNSNEKRKAPNPPVTVVAAQTLHFQETVGAIGSLEAPETIRISPEIDALIETLHFREGEKVSSGDLLVSLDKDKLRREVTSAQASLERARAEARDAKRSYDRFQELFERNTISEEERDERRTRWETSRAEADRLQEQLELMRERLDDATIRAPRDGVLSERQVDAGDFVEAGEVLVTLYILDPLEISFTVPEAYMGRVKRDMEVNVEVAAYPDCTFPGVITFVSPSIDPATRKFLVKSRVPNPEGQLKPGGFARVVLILSTRDGRPAVPEQALVATRDGYSLFVVEDGAARKRDIRIGLRRPGVVEVLQGLEPGEAVVAKGQLRLTDGAEVDVTRELTLQEAVPQETAEPLEGAYCPPGANATAPADGGDGS